MSDVRIDLVEVDDWAGLYIDGQLQSQNHQVEARDVLDDLRHCGLLDGVRFEHEFYEGDAAERLTDEGGGQFPQTLPQWLREEIDSP